MGLIQYIREHPLNSILAGAASFLTLDVAYRIADGLMNGNLKIPYFEAAAAGTVAVVAGGKILYDHVKGKEAKDKSASLEKIANGDPVWAFELRRGMPENQIRKQINTFANKYKGASAVDKRALYDSMSIVLEDLPGASARIELVANDISKYGKVNQQKGNAAKKFEKKANFGIVITHFGEDGSEIGLDHYKGLDITKDGDWLREVDTSNSGVQTYLPEQQAVENVDEDLERMIDSYNNRPRAQPAAAGQPQQQARQPGPVRRGRQFRAPAQQQAPAQPAAAQPPQNP